MWWRPREPSYDLEPVMVNGRQYQVQAAEARGRTASASLRDGVIVIRMPRLAEGREAEALFLNLKRRISRAIETHPERFERHELEFRHGQVIRVPGRMLTVFVEETEGGRIFARAYEDRVVVRIPSDAGQERKGELVTEAVTKAVARSYLPFVAERVAELNARHYNVEVNRVRLRRISSRWGSYSRASRNISLNIRLLFGPMEILDYVIVHELSHGMYHDHGKRFWKLVGSVLPDYRERRRWLNRNGDMLGRALAVSYLPSGQSHGPEISAAPGMSLPLP